MIINERAGSGGDAMPWYFKRAGVGKLIGTRTWGGLVGMAGGPPLMDGGFVGAPSSGIYNPLTGEWEVENIGVPPDIEVEQDPALVRKGRDPQLEKAVEVAHGGTQEESAAGTAASGVSELQQGYDEIEGRRKAVLQPRMAAPRDYSGRWSSMFCRRLRSRVRARSTRSRRTIMWTPCRVV